MISLKNTLSAITNMLNDVPHYTLLWTNPSPSDNFSAQTISLDLSKYDAVEITFKSSGITTIRSDIDGKSREANYIESSGAGYIQAARRGYTTSSTGISFGKGYWNFGAHYPWNETSDACVPYKIYGIKFGGGV